MAPILTSTHEQQLKKSYYETSPQSLDTGSLLRLHFTHSPVRIEQVERGMVATCFLRVSAHVLLFCWDSHVTDAA